MLKKHLVLGLSLLASSSLAMAQPPGGPGGGPGMRGGGQMQHADTDGDGRVSLAERQAMATQRFQKEDTNGDGYVTKEEMQTGQARRQEFRQKMQDLKKQYGQQ